MESIQLSPNSGGGWFSKSGWLEGQRYKGMGEVIVPIHLAAVVPVLVQADSRLLGSAFRG